MRELNRIYRICHKIITFWTKHSDYRFFQVVSYLEYYIHLEKPDKDLFYLEDDLFERILDKLLESNL